MRRYAVYLFDFDYTLADSSRGIVTCFRQVLDRHGYEGISDEAIKQTIGKTLEDSFSILTGVTDDAILAGFKKEYVKEADTYMTANTHLYPETQRVLGILKGEGALIGIISTKFRYRIKECLDRHFPADFFDVIIGGEDVEAHKPSPEGVLKAIDTLGAGKRSVLYVGDSTVDAETAQAAQVDFAGILHGVTTREALAAYPHRCILPSLEGLVGKKELALSKPKKWIGIWQIVVLALLAFLAVEGDGEGDYTFTIIFLATLWSVAWRRKILPPMLHERLKALLHPLIARGRMYHIAIIRGKKLPAVNDQPCVCRNCKTTFTGNYCNRCGQGRNTPRYRLHNVVQNILGAFTKINKGLVRTSIELLYRPGYMIKDFLAGKRVNYLMPFQMLFVLAALYVMTIEIVNPGVLRKLTPTEQAEADSLAYMKERADLMARMGRVSTHEEKKTLQWLVERLDKDEMKRRERLKEGVAGDNDWFGISMNKEIRQFNRTFDGFKDHHPFVKKVSELLQRWTHGNKAFRIVATLPLLALGAFWVFRRRCRRYNYTEHLFIQAYIACQVLLVSIVAIPFKGTATIKDLYEIPTTYIYLLFCFDYKQLFGGSWGSIFWRTLCAVVCCGLLFVLLAALLITGGLIIGSLV